MAQALLMARARLPSHDPASASAVAAVTALDLIGAPAAVLGPMGLPVAKNAGFAQLMPDVAKERDGRLRLANAAADIQFADAVRQLAHGLASVCSIPIPAASGRPPMIVQLIPVQGVAREQVPGALAIVVMIPVATRDIPTAELIQGLFNLTPAEARVARAVAARETIDGVASAFNLSRETVRSQLKGALGKIGVARNIDLAVLLACAGLHRLPDAS
jgi:DNA-binding CsgD family transcriptional regulator